MRSIGCLWFHQVCSLRGMFLPEATSSTAAQSEEMWVDRLMECQTTVGSSTHVQTKALGQVAPWQYPGLS